MQFFCATPYGLHLEIQNDHQFSKFVYYHRPQETAGGVVFARNVVLYSKEETLSKGNNF